MNPHDRVIMEKGSKVGELKGDLLHYSFPTIASHVETANKFSDIVADELHQKGTRPGLLRIILNPPFTFFKKYILRGGFLDGYYGFLVCVISSYYNFLKYAKGRARFFKD